MKKLSLLSYALSILLLVSTGFSQDANVTALSKVGQTAYLQVTADGTEPFTYQWRKDGVVLSGATANPLVLSGLSLTSAGSYSVVVSNSIGSATSNLAILKVMAPPVFTSQPVAVVTTIGKPVTLTAVASASPTPTYQWIKNGVVIVGATASTYTIPVSAQSDSGNYSCVATSTLDTLVVSATSNVVAVTVNIAPPVITNITISIK
jgi:hypothetical protein